MICPVCKTDLDRAPRREKGKTRYITALICPVCMERKSQAVYLESQKAYLPEVFKGRGELTLTYPAGAKRFHIRLAGEPTHAFCGEKVPRQWFKKYQRLDDGLREQLCPGCRGVLEELRKELEVA